MTDNEIIKALDCCANCESCDFEITNEDFCPLVEEIECRSLLAQKALDLITRKHAENENLKVENQSLRDAANSLKMHYEEAQAEIERLNKVIRQTQQLINALNKSYFLAKAEAYKEFAERLKELDGYNNHNFDDCVNLLVSDEYIRGRYEKINEIWSTIDILLKEKEDNNNN